MHLVLYSIVTETIQQQTMLEYDGSYLLSDGQTYNNDSQEHKKSSISQPNDHIPECNPTEIQDLWEIVREKINKMTDLDSRPPINMNVSQVSFWKL